MVVPDACYKAICTKLEELEKPRYFLADARIEDMMEKKFLNEQVKTGKITPPSYPRPIS